jgi:hypothetical protein
MFLYNQKLGFVPVVLVVPLYPSLFFIFIFNLKKIKEELIRPILLVLPIQFQFKSSKKLSLIRGFTAVHSPFA